MNGRMRPSAVLWKSASRRRSASVRSFAVSFGIAVAVCALCLVGLLGALHIFSISYYRVTTGSMEPDFPIGTVVIDNSMPPKVHQAVTFVADGHIVTHVLIGYNKDGSLITQGIANMAPDVWRTAVYPRDVRGRVILEVLPLRIWIGAHARIAAMSGCIAGIALLVLYRGSYSRLQSSSK